MRWGKRMEAIGNMHRSACSSVIFLTSRRSRRGDFLEMVLWGDHWTRVHSNEYGEDSSGHQPVTSDQWPGSDFTIDFTIKIYYRDYRDDKAQIGVPWERDWCHLGSWRIKRRIWWELLEHGYRKCQRTDAAWHRMGLTALVASVKDCLTFNCFALILAEWCRVMSRVLKWFWLLGPWGSTKPEGRTLHRVQT